ncbi:MAG TPA: hypothetical protein VJ252_04795 [Chthoniobacterales bacterium]|nr:hypothetical protein [Chthoniobacterales bacterium]
MKREAKFVSFVLAAWLCFALAVGVANWFQPASAPVVALTVWTLTGLILLACWKFDPISTWAATVDLRWLVLLHTTRFVGFYFLILCRRGELPCAFATPAGIGDIAIAAATVIILLVPKLRASRRLLLIWNSAGLLDIVFVVFTALRAGLRDWPSMAPLRELPLGLLPTFLVPLIIASHVLIFVRLARSKTE